MKLCELFISAWGVIPEKNRRGHRDLAFLGVPIFFSYTYSDI